MCDEGQVDKQLNTLELHSRIVTTLFYMLFVCVYCWKV